MKRECEEFIARLCDGMTPASDAALGEHVGSCLDCFRAMTELRDVPRLADALRVQGPGAPDPGDSFWAGFPGRVYQADVDSRRSTVDGALSPLRSLMAWLRRPIPAAFAGAACATAIAVLVARPWIETPSTTTAAVAPATADFELPPSDDIADLDLRSLREVASHIVDDDDDVTEFVQAVSDDEGVLSPVQRLENLDDEALQALANVLREAPI